MSAGILNFADILNGPLQMGQPLCLEITCILWVIRMQSIGSQEVCRPLWRGGVRVRFTEYARSGLECSTTILLLCSHFLCGAMHLQYNQTKVREKCYWRSYAELCQ